MDPALSAFLVQLFAATLKELLTDAPAIQAAMQKVMTSTLADSQPDPQLDDALRKAQIAAVAAGVLPPGDVR